MYSKQNRTRVSIEISISNDGESEDANRDRSADSKETMQKFIERIPKSRKSGAGKKKSKRINRLLDHYRKSPHIPYPIMFWPSDLRDYIVRCFDTCKNDQEKILLQSMIKEKLLILNDCGILYKNNNWRKEPILELPVKIEVKTENDLH